MVTVMESKRLFEGLLQEGGNLARDIFLEHRQSEHALWTVMPSLVDEMRLASATLGADMYASERLRQGAAGVFVPAIVLLDRKDKIGNALAWAFNDETGARLLDVVRTEVGRSYRDTVMDNISKDPKATRWQRISRGGCGFCLALADRGAVYKWDTVAFGAHDNCRCTVAPLFRGGVLGGEEDVLDYVPTGRIRSAAQKARTNAWARSYVED